MLDLYDLLLLCWLQMRQWYPPQKQYTHLYNIQVAATAVSCKRLMFSGCGSGKSRAGEKNDNTTSVYCNVIGKIHYCT